MSDTLPAAPYRVDELSIEDGLDIAMWRTPGPWAVEDSLTSPRPDEGYWAVRSANNALVGYCVFGEKARPLGLPAKPGTLDVAIGIAPQYAGRHLSQAFAKAVLDRGREVAEDRRLRTAVAGWNAVGRHTTESAGFRLSGMHEVKGGAQVTSYYVYEM
ncbi:MAG TPA: GNAT family N-acetyltransferase [Dermatophilaceae bacterium]|nr:GNAT family N-acetyltransferase [Dermatophilaceae bacterium]